MFISVILASAACTLPPPLPPEGATIPQVKAAYMDQMAWNTAVAHGPKAVRKFVRAYCHR